MLYAPKVRFKEGIKGRAIETFFTTFWGRASYHMAETVRVFYNFKYPKEAKIDCLF